MKYLVTTTTCVIILFIVGCCKKKHGNECIAAPFQISPFIEKTNVFMCNDTNEYIAIFQRKEQIDSLSPQCFSTKPIPYPVDETNMVYLILARMSYHYHDTFALTSLLKDTCNKKLTYEVSMVQRDTALFQFPGIMSIYCSVENIPADYQVEVKYKYVPIQ